MTVVVVCLEELYACCTTIGMTIAGSNCVILRALMKGPGVISRDLQILQWVATAETKREWLPDSVIYSSARTWGGDAASFGQYETKQPVWRIYRGSSLSGLEGRRKGIDTVSQTLFENPVLVFKLLAAFRRAKRTADSIIPVYAAVTAIGEVGNILV
jgi:hypothetical protein